MRDKLLKLIELKGDLPPLPDVILNLQDRVNDPNSDIQKIAILIETDPVLSGRLLKIANSVFFSGGRDPAEDLQSALMRLGLKMVVDLVYTSELPKLFKKSHSFDQMKFWKHSLAVGFLSRSIGRKIIANREQLEVCYLCGLMHDLGILVFDYLVPDEYETLIKEAKSSGDQKTLSEVEKDKFGIAHPELGARFMKKWWPIRPEVIQAVEKQEDTAPKRGTQFNNRDVLWLADHMANDRDITNGVDLFKKPSDDGVFADCGLDPDDVEDLMEEANHGLEQSEAMLKG